MLRDFLVSIIFKS